LCDIDAFGLWYKLTSGLVAFLSASSARLCVQSC
jgi:hypothetical protein